MITLIGSQGLWLSDSYILVALFLARKLTYGVREVPSSVLLGLSSEPNEPNEPNEPVVPPELDGKLEARFR